MLDHKETNEKDILLRHKLAIDKRLAFTQVPWYPMRQMQATIGVILDLDLDIGLEELITCINHTADYLVLISNNQPGVFDLGKYARYLYRLGRELQWIASNGCR